MTNRDEEYAIIGLLMKYTDSGDNKVTKTLKIVKILKTRKVCLKNEYGKNQTEKKLIEKQQLPFRQNDVETEWDLCVLLYIILDRDYQEELR